MQQICLSLVLGTPDLPRPLADLSPWVDWLVEPEESLFARLEDQVGRRVVKTHTPLDGVVLDPRASYVVVVRDPLDMAVSMYHQGDNLDRERIAELSGRPVHVPPPRPELPEWLVAWTRREADPFESMDSLPGVVRHAADAWARRCRARARGAVRGPGRRPRGPDAAPGCGPGRRCRARPLAGAGRGRDVRVDARGCRPSARPTGGASCVIRRRSSVGGGRGRGVRLLGATDLTAYESRVRELAERYAAPGEERDVAVLLGVA